MEGVQDKLGDLSWLGEAYTDQGWVQVEGAVNAIAESTPAELVWEKAKQQLRESDWAMLPDVPMTVEEKQQWVSYRMSLRNIRSQVGFPNAVVWPSKPS
jgi:hypothetical protein